jgi:hypothetical protein
MTPRSVVAKARRQASKMVGRATRGLPLVGGADRGTQIALTLAYQSRLAAGQPMPALADVEFHNTAQQGEDGILLFLFALCGHGGRRAVEMCAGDGIECNAANLILHHGWDALLVDGDEHLLEQGRSFYSQNFETRRVPPTLQHAWITGENAQRLIDDHGFGDELDLLSLDLDGIDYWILDALTVTPRVIVCEYNNRVPAGMALTVPYQSDFVVEGDQAVGEGFFGASLDAFVHLLGPRGYRLIGANRHNTNAFFLREDVLGDVLPVVSPASCLSSPWAKSQRARWWDALQHKPWVHVDRST